MDTAEKRLILTKIGHIYSEKGTLNGANGEIDILNRAEGHLLVQRDILV